MANPFKPDDKVLIKVKGADVEATVRLVWRDEVQVRTPDKTLLWRTVKTVRYPDAAPEGAATAQPFNSEGDANGEIQAESAIPVQTEPVPEAKTNTIEPSAEPQVGDSLPVPSAVPVADVSPCGVPETVEERKRSNKKKGRRR